MATENTALSGAIHSEQPALPGQRLDSFRNCCNSLRMFAPDMASRCGSFISRFGKPVLD